MVVAIVTRFLWCHVCFLPALLCPLLCWDPWAFVGPKLNILRRESRSMATVRAAGRPNCSDWDMQGEGGGWEGRGRDSGLWNTVPKNSSPQSVPQGPGKERHSLGLFKNGKPSSVIPDSPRLLSRECLPFYWCFLPKERKVCTVKRSRTLAIETCML